MTIQLNATYKGFPGHLAPIDLKDVGAQQWQVLQGDLPFPLAVIRQSSLQTTSIGCKIFAKSAV
jgi:D-serine dehydratase